MIRQSKEDSGLAYKQVGRGVPVVFLHGFCGSKAYWSSIEAALKSQVEAYYVDLPGHGDSRTFLKTSIEEYIELLHTWKKEVGLDQFILIGHSLGGYIALAYAEKYTQDLLGYALVHSTAFPDSEEGKEGRDAGIKKIESEGMTAFIDGLVPKLFDKEFSQNHSEVLYHAKKIGAGTNSDQAIAFLKAMKNRHDRRDVLKKGEIPHLLVAGENDGVIPSYKTFISESPNATEKLVKNSAHMSMYESPEVLSETVIQWIQQLRIPLRN